jgi:CHAT domain-containing protein/tetratricopeptide (TPR) repeat protein
MNIKQHYNLIFSLFFLIFLLINHYSLNAGPPLNKNGEAFIFDSIAKIDSFLNTNKTDSAINRFNQLDKSLIKVDTALDLYLKLSNHLYYNSNFKQSLEISFKGLKYLNNSFSSNSHIKMKLYFNIARSYYEMKNVSSADSIINIIISSFESSNEYNDILLSHSYYNKAMYLEDMYDFELALSYYNKALDIYTNKNEKIYIGACYNNIANVFRYKGNFEKSKKYNLEAIKIIESISSQGIELTIAYLNFAGHLFNAGDLEKSKTYYTRSGQIIKNNKSAQYLNKYMYLGLAEINRIEGNYCASIQLYKEALKIHYSYFSMTDYEAGFIVSSLARVYHENNKIEKSIIYFEKAFKILKNNYHLKKEYFYDNLFINAEIYVKNKEILKAKKMLSESLNGYIDIFGRRHPRISTNYIKLAEISLRNNKFAQALDLCQQSIIANAYNFNDSTIFSFPKYDDLIQPIDHLEAQIFKLQVIRSSILARNKRFSKKDLYRLFNNITNTIKLIQSNFHLLKSKYALIEKSHHYTQFAFEIININELTDLKDDFFSFSISENNKASILLELTKLSKILSRNHKKLNDAISDLKIDITFYNNKLNEENSKQNPDSARVTYYENLLFDFNRDYEALIDTLETKYPDYYDLKHRNYVASVDDVQKELLDANSALVEYYYSDSAMYAFTITKNDYEVYELGVPKHFKQWLSNFRKAQTDARFLLDSATTANQLYFSSGHALYKHLLQPVLADLDSGITNLIIVPDGELGHINFETLLTDSVGSSSGSYADLPYLLKDYNIQYAYSATVLLSAKRHKRKAPAAFFAGFAPNYANLATTVAGDSSADQMVVELTRSGNYQLPGAISEVENLAALTGGDAFINAAASERAFKQNADRYQVLHLAMHGLVNDRDAMYSKLLFTQTEDTLEDNYLNAAEIFNLDLSADLVVLSACNTGYGQVNRGEGIMSLSRAFKYAGSPSLVMSLWQIPDQPTSAIMNRFYENLMEGQRKDVALRNAKLDFLNANRGNLRSHPFYWAGLIPIGDMQPLAVESWIERNMLLLAGLLLLLIAAVMAGRRFSKQ